MPRLTRSLIAAVGVFTVVLSTTVASATTLTKEIDEPDADEFAVDGARRADRDRPDAYGAFWGHAVTELDGSTTLHMYRPSCETFTGGIYKAWGRRHSG